MPFLLREVAHLDSDIQMREKKNMQDSMAGLEREMRSIGRMQKRYNDKLKAQPDGRNVLHDTFQAFHNNPHLLRSYASTPARTEGKDSAIKLGNSKFMRTPRSGANV